MKGNCRWKTREKALFGTKKESKLKVDFERGIELLRKGEIVAIPTDTVYGLAADMHHRQAVNRIYALKGRPKEKPFLVLIAGIRQMTPYVSSFPTDFEKLASTFWPGGLKENVLFPL